MNIKKSSLQAGLKPCPTKEYSKTNVGQSFSFALLKIMLSTAKALPYVLSLVMLFAMLLTSKAAVYAGTQPLYREGELLVKFKPGVEKAAAGRIHAMAGASIKKRFNRFNVEHVALPPGISVKEAVKLYRKDPSVEYAEPNYIIRKATIPDDPHFSLQWGLHNTGQTIQGITGTPDADIDAPEAWDIHTGNGSVVVAVIDSGVDYNHPDLFSNIWKNQGETSCTDGIDNDGNGFIDDCRGWDFVNNDNDPMDDDPDGHGTPVAGVLGAVGNNGIGGSGVNWNIKIMPLKFIDSSGFGLLSDEIAAIDYALANGARIINASYASESFAQAERDAVKAARDADVLFVAAAGNGGEDNDVTPVYPASHNLDNIISVAATGQNDSLIALSDFGRLSVHLSAPGENILVPVPQGGYAYGTGTSFSTPMVSGVAGLLLSNKPGLAYFQVKNFILNSVDDSGLPLITGGRLNAFNAIKASITNNPPPAPELVFPVNGQTGLATSITFRWKSVTDPDSDRITYLFFYSEDAAFTGVAPIEVASLEKRGVYYAGIYSAWLCLPGMLLSFAIKRRRKIVLFIAPVVLISGMLLSSCGGGGGGSSGDSNNEVTHTVTGLKNNTKYYWKVVADDGNNGKTESETRNFTTQ